jgi:hypothetical protein
VERRNADRVVQQREQGGQDSESQNRDLEAPEGRPQVGGKTIVGREGAPRVLQNWLVLQLPGESAGELVGS